MGARLAWQLPKLSFSLCPTGGVAYDWSGGWQNAFGIGIGRKAQLGDASSITFFAFPQYVQTRFEVDGTPTRPARTESIDGVVTELGFRVAGRFLYGGLSLLMGDPLPDRRVLNVAVGVKSNRGAAAETPSQDNTMRDRFGFSAGVMWGDNGNHPDNQCSAGTGLSLGAEARTQGSWLLAAGVDLLTHMSSACTTMLIVRTYQGQGVSVEVDPAIFGPRFTLHAGRAFRVRDIVLEPAAGAGVILQRIGDGSDPDRTFWSEWYGGSVRLRASHGKALLIEYGWREIPITYYSLSTPRSVVHRFSEREPLLRAMVEF